MDAEEYDAIIEEIKLLAKVAQAEKRIIDGEAYINLEDLRIKLGIHENKK